MSVADLSHLQQRSKTLTMASAESTLRTYAREQRDRTATEAAELLARANGKPSETVRDRVAALLAESDQWAAREAEYDRRADQRSATAAVVREPLTYDRHGEHSWVLDQISVAKGGYADDSPAMRRLERHRKEMDVEQRARAKQARRRRGDVPEPEGTSFERRAVIDSPGAPAYGTPPLWLGALTPNLPRPERVLSDLITSYDLPDGIASVNVPRLTAGTAADLQAPGTPDDTNDITDVATSSQAVLISGHSDLPIQMIEQSPAGAASVDEIVWRDLLSAWDAQLEAQLINGEGNGSNWQLRGLLNVSGINSITYTSGSPTGVGLFKPLGEAFGAVSDNRKVRPECWVMRGGRWAWLTTAEDKQERPISPPIDVQSPTAPAGPVGTLLGNCPVFTSEAIPTTLGSGGNQDVIFALRPRDSLLWEGAPKLTVDSQSMSGALQVRVHLRAYAAAILSRLPSSIATITGTGMKVETNE